jgi:hypothetical protein
MAHTTAKHNISPLKHRLQRSLSTPLAQGQSYELNLKLDDIDTIIRQSRELWSTHQSQATRQSVEDLIALAEKAFVHTFKHAKQMQCKPNTCVTKQLTLSPFYPQAQPVLSPCQIIHNFPSKLWLGPSIHPTTPCSSTASSDSPSYLSYICQDTHAHYTHTLQARLHNNNGIAQYVQILLQIPASLKTALDTQAIANKLAQDQSRWASILMLPCVDRTNQAFVLRLVRPNENGRALALAYALQLDNEPNLQQRESILPPLARLLTLLHQYAMFKRGRHTSKS